MFRETEKMGTEIPLGEEKSIENIVRDYNFLLVKETEKMGKMRVKRDVYRKCRDIIIFY